MVWCCALSVMAQGAESFGVERNMPVFFEQLKQAAVGKDTLGDMREKVMATMQMAPPPPLDYSYDILDTEQREGYKAHLISFNINEWERVKAYLLVPDGGKKKRYAGLLMLHDHGAHFTIGKEKMVRPMQTADSLTIADAAEWVRACYDDVYVGDDLAREGYVVLSIDALFWGDRGPKEMAAHQAKGLTIKEVNKAVYDQQQALASNMLQMGTSWGAWITWDDMRAAEFLAHLPMVDGDRVGCLGFSMGAYRSWMLAAFSDCIKASASICWMNDTDHLMTLTNNQNKGGSAFSMLIPGIRNVADYPQVAAMAAPKASLFFNGKRDKLFPVDGVESAYAVLRKAWEKRNASDRLVTKIWDEKHFFNKAMQQEVKEFFSKFF